MKRTRITLSALVVAVLVFGAALATAGAAAADVSLVSAGRSADGSHYVEEYIDLETGCFYYWLTTDHKEWLVLDYCDDGNPNPEDASSGAKEHAAEKIASLRDVEIPQESFWGTSVGRALGEHGIGPDTVWNPNADGSSTSSGNGVGKEELKGLDALLAEIDGGLGGGGGYEPNGDSAAQQLKRAASKGGGASDDDDDSSPPPPPGEELPGPADVVNPPTVSR